MRNEYLCKVIQGLEKRLEVSPTRDIESIYAHIDKRADIKSFQFSDCDNWMPYYWKDMRADLERYTGESLAEINYREHKIILDIINAELRCREAQRDGLNVERRGCDVVPVKKKPSPGAMLTQEERDARTGAITSLLRKTCTLSEAEHKAVALAADGALSLHEISKKIPKNHRTGKAYTKQGVRAILDRAAIKMGDASLFRTGRSWRDEVHADYNEAANYRPSKHY